MLKIRSLTITWLAGVLIALACVVGLFTRRIEAARRTPPASAEAVSARTAQDSDTPVIHFVKDPQEAPPLQARDLRGRPVTKEDWPGKVVLVNFWATWCPPCREEIPELLALKKEYGDRLQIVGISEDDDPPEQVLKFVQRMGMTYPVVMATPQLLDSYGGVPALPTSFLIDTHGGVVQKHTGLYPIEWYDREIQSLLGLPTDARVETFVDTGQVFLKNAANATELPGVDFTGLNAEQKKRALHRMNSENCTCGCGLTISECRVNDSQCDISTDLAAKIVKQTRRGNAPAPKSRTPSASPKGTNASPKGTSSTSLISQ